LGPKGSLDDANYGDWLPMCDPLLFISFFTDFILFYFILLEPSRAVDSLQEPLATMTEHRQTEMG